VDMKFRESKYSKDLRGYEEDSPALPAKILIKGERNPSHWNYTPDYWVVVWEAAERFRLFRGENTLTGDFKTDYAELR
jgi:hypothetical protein